LIELYPPELPMSHENVQISLAEALRAGWVEFWYQPKINIRMKQIVGVESFARIRHPAFGIVSAGAFMRDAEKYSLATLAEQAILNAVETSLKLSKFGINARLTVNLSIRELTNLPILALVRKYISPATKWAGIILDLPESEVMQKMGTVAELSGKLRSCNVELAVDGFGRCLFASSEHRNTPLTDADLLQTLGQFSQLRSIQFAEAKLDPAVVKGCGKNPRHHAICKVMIDLSHSIGATSVAVGVENSSDLLSLQDMGCSLAQGFLFSEPLSYEQFFTLLRGRAGSQNRTAPSDRTAGV
jgi:EAL domain-containing protein (putative c-di-GMP-specific phosphodiesterase class I)